MLYHCCMFFQVSFSQPMHTFPSLLRFNSFFFRSTWRSLLFVRLAIFILTFLLLFHFTWMLLLFFYWAAWHFPISFCSRLKWRKKPKNRNQYTFFMIALRRCVVFSFMFSEKSRQFPCDGKKKNAVDWIQLVLMVTVCYITSRVISICCEHSSWNKQTHGTKPSPLWTLKCLVCGDV